MSNGSTASRQKQQQQQILPLALQSPSHLIHPPCRMETISRRRDRVIEASTAAKGTALRLKKRMIPFLDLAQGVGCHAEVRLLFLLRLVSSRH